jgi:Ca2+-binding RTX toxin-like protein
VNGDGVADIIVGADRADPNGSYSGATYVIFGKAPFEPSISLATLDGTNGFRLEGVAANDFSGFSVSSAGDVNGDGFDDVIVGAYGADPNAGRSGASYVVFGKSSDFAPSINLGTLDGSNGFRLDGVGEDNVSGFSVSGAGDVNGDGFDDVIVGAFAASPNGLASGASYVVFGKASGFASSTNLSTLDGSNGFRLDGVAAFDYSGISVSDAGDVNGDGYDDLIVGAYCVHASGAQSGASYVVFGKASGFAAATNLSTLDGSNGFRLEGETTGDFLGRAVSAAGDVNGDGFDDVIVGASRAEPNGDLSGASYVVFGKASGFAPSISLSTLDGSNGFRINGLAAFDFAGFSVSGAGDINNDGFDDLITGRTADTNHVVFGKPSGFAASINLSSIDGTNGFRLEGEGLSGRAVGAAGDVNDDGYDDLIVGAFAADVNGIESGASYVVFGRNFAAEVITGTDGDDTLNGSSSDDSIDGGAGNDVLSGLEGNDTLIGGPGDDSLHGGDGTDTAEFSGIYADYAISTLYGGKDNPLAGYQVSSAAEGVDFVSADVEQLQFSDKQISLLIGTSGDDTLNGTDGHDRMEGLGGNDLLNGGARNDTLVGGIGSDTMAGGSGNDTYVVESTADVVTENAGEGTDLVQSSVSYVLGPTLENLVLTGARKTNGTGNVADNNLTGNAFANRLDGHEGNDSLSGLDGNDTLFGGTGDDSLYGGNGTDSAAFSGDFANYEIVALYGGQGGAVSGYQVSSLAEGADFIGTDVEYLKFGGRQISLIAGTTANDSLSGGNRDDRMEGLAGNDLLNGGSGNDTLYGGDGNDTLDGGKKVDVLVGGVGDDAYFVDGILAVVTESPDEGMDIVFASITYALAPEVENLVLIGTRRADGTGNALDNALTGNAAGNLLSGSSGEDVLAGGAGADTLIGGDGNDTFVLDSPLSSKNVDLVVDFEVGSDVLVLSEAVFQSLQGQTVLAASQFYAASGASVATDASQRIVYDPNTGNLFYDADGMGGIGPVSFAVVGVTVHPDLAAEDFSIG